MWKKEKHKLGNIKKPIINFFCFIIFLSTTAGGPSVARWSYLFAGKVEIRDLIMMLPIANCLLDIFLLCCEILCQHSRWQSDNELTLWHSTDTAVIYQHILPHPIYIIRSHQSSITWSRRRREIDSNFSAKSHAYENAIYFPDHKLPAICAQIKFSHPINKIMLHLHDYWFPSLARGALFSLEWYINKFREAATSQSRNE